MHFLEIKFNEILGSNPLSMQRKGFAQRTSLVSLTRS
uniref:Uncharacterized protein n=1 Tax=Picea sitchensis TaxID=3332 RepID=A9NYC6_PICSI|nr:unknown [Picea sitchensis]